MAPGVFCVEGQWARDLNARGSVLPLLELLERLGNIRFIHRDVATRDEMDYYLNRWLLRQYADYRVGYFAMHGSRGGLSLNDREMIDLDELAALMSGRCAGRRLYFGSCSVLYGSDSKLQKFLAETGAELVCGYTGQVDWLESAAFEAVLLDVLANGAYANAAQLRMGRAQWVGLAAHLKFRIVYANGTSWRPPAAPAKLPAQAVPAHDR